MGEELFSIGIGVVSALVYCYLGLGVARAVMGMGQPFRTFVFLFWPIALGVIAATGDIDA